MNWVVYVGGAGGGCQYNGIGLTGDCSYFESNLEDLDRYEEVELEGSEASRNCPYFTVSRAAALWLNPNGGSYGGSTEVQVFVIPFGECMSLKYSLIWPEGARLAGWDLTRFGFH